MSEYMDWYKSSVEPVTADSATGFSNGIKTPATPKGSFTNGLAEAFMAQPLSAKTSGSGGISSASDTPWYQDGNMLSGLASLGSLAMQLASFSDMKKHASLTNQALAHNLNEAKADSALKAQRQANLNAVRTA